MSSEYRFVIPEKAKARMEEMMRVLATDTPACWAWPVDTKAHDGMDSRDMHNLMTDWQNGRCAVCAGRMTESRLDHDHDTGLVRGWLCTSCNLQEGHGGGLLFDRYREQHPTVMLGITMKYYGR